MLREAGKERGAGWIGGLLEKVKGGKKLELILYGAVILTVLLLYASGLRRNRSETSADSAESYAGAEAVMTEQDLENKLASVLSCIRGAGRVEVMVTYETGAELVTAMSTSTNSNASETTDNGKASASSQTTESMEPATVKGENGDTPIVLMERLPVVRGVIVVAEGAADISVKLDLQRAVQAVLDIPLSQIEVFELSATGYE